MAHDPYKNSEPTPGPWVAEQYGSLWDIRPEVGVHPCAYIAYISSARGLECGGGTQDGNAFLVAASPDLRDRLIESNRYLRQYRSIVADWKRQCEPETDDTDIEEAGHLDDELNGLDRQIEENAKAMAKARGEDQAVPETHPDHEGQ